MEWRGGVGGEGVEWRGGVGGEGVEGEGGGEGWEWVISPPQTNTGLNVRQAGRQAVDRTLFLEAEKHLLLNAAHQNKPYNQMIISVSSHFCVQPTKAYKYSTVGISAAPQTVGQDSNSGRRFRGRDTTATPSSPFF